MGAAAGGSAFREAGEQGREARWCPPAGFPGAALGPREQPGDMDGRLQELPPVLVFSRN